MIRAIVALTVGLAGGSIYESRPVRSLRRWALRFELRLTVNEIADTSDDIADARLVDDFRLADTLTDYYTELCNHRDALRKQLAALSSPTPERT